MTDFLDAPISEPTDDTYLVGGETEDPTIWNKYRGNKYIGCVPYGHICVTTSAGKKLFKVTEGIDNVSTIESAYAYADSHLPMVDIEFGAGYFDIVGGTQYEPDSTDPSKWGLTIRGQGKATQMRFIGDSPYATGKWFAIRIKPVVVPTVGDFDNYLHSFSIQNMSAYDEAPYLHATTEETHGFNIQYCVGASLSNNNLYNIGDEGVEADYCHGLMMSGNYCWRCNIAEEDGGAGVSCKNGSGEVTIVNNVVTDNIPDLWDGGKTYAQGERALGSDGVTYKSNANGNTGNDPAGAGAASWTSVSALNGGEGPNNYGIDVKLAAAAAVTNVTIAGNTIARVETSAYRIANTNDNSSNITISGSSVETVDHFISKTGSGCKGLVVSGVTAKDIRKDVVKTENNQAGVDDDKDWIIDDLVVDTAGGDILNLTRMSGLKLTNSKFNDIAGAAFDGELCEGCENNGLRI